MTDNKYKKANYTVTIDLDKTPDDVFAHLIDLGKWWPEDFSGADIKPDSEFVLTTGDSHYSRNRVIEFVPGKKLVWLTLESMRKTDNYDWSGTKMIFELLPKEGRTVVQFIYDGVVLEGESDRLANICDLTIKELFYNYVMNAKKENKSFETTIVVSKSPREVFDRITRDVAKWWGGNDLQGSSKRLGDEFIIHHPGAHYSKQRVVEAEPDKKIVWLVTESTLDCLKRDQHEWTNTRMIFEIARTDDKTSIHFAHDGLVPEKECYAMCAQGWTLVIEGYLFQLIENDKAHF